MTQPYILPLPPTQNQPTMASSMNAASPSQGIGSYDTDSLLQLGQTIDQESQILLSQVQSASQAAPSSALSSYMPLGASSAGLTSPTMSTAAAGQNQQSSIVAQLQAVLPGFSASQIQSALISNMAPGSTSMPSLNLSSPDPSSASSTSSSSGSSSSSDASHGTGALPSAAAGTDKAKLIDYAKQMAQKYGIPEDIFLRQIQQESGFSTNAVSSAGAIGIAQFMPDTAKGFGIDPHDPYQSLDAAAKFDQQLYKEFGSWTLAMAAYNSGPGNVQKYKGVPPFPETQQYVKIIVG